MTEDACGWYYLHPTGENYGPYSTEALQDLYIKGFVLPDMVVWQQGRQEWVPFKDVPELFDTAKLTATAQLATDTKRSAASEHLANSTTAPLASRNAAPPNSDTAAAITANGSQTTAPQPNKGPHRGPVIAAAPAAVVTAAQGDADAELAAFQAEMGLLGALQNKSNARPSTPEELRFQDDDGTWYEWDRGLRKYVEAAEPGPSGIVGPQYDEADMAFDVEQEVIPEYNPQTDDADEIADELEAEKHGGSRKGKRKHMDTPSDDAEHGGTDADAQEAQHNGTKKKGNDQPEGWVEIKVNTSVYVTGLPEDVTEAELAEVFKKCGLLRPDDEGKPKVKVYRDKATGRPKGDGLVTFLKQPSVILACQLMDGAQFRLGQGKPMTVTEAKFEQKGDVFKAKPQEKKKKKKGKKPVEAELGWDGFDDVAKVTEATVVLKHMFDPQELRGDKKLAKDLQDDVADECRKHGSLGKIRVFTWNPEGVVSVRFLSADAADACVKVMNGRFFGGRRIEALLWDGVTNYHVAAPKEREEDQQARLEAFSRELDAAEPPKYD